MNLGTFGTMPQTAPMPIVATAAKDVRNENQFFDFEKEQVQVLTLDELKRTNMENRGDDRSCPHGIYHYALIQQILDMAAQQGYDAEVYDLFATNNRDKQTPGVSLYPELEARYGERAIEAHTLRRVYANIRLRNFDTDEMTTCLALSYTQRGIQVGFGRNVKVCRNQNILGNGYFVSDYSTGAFHYAKGDMEKTDLNGILRAVGSWLTDAEHIIIQNDEVIERMKRSILTPEQLYTILGLLTVIRVTNDTKIKSIHVNQGVAPLNQAQISRFTEGLLVKQKEVGQISAWDFYNCATELYKPQIVDQNQILPETLSMFEFMSTHELY
jgi:hypothetical protein